MTNVWVIVLVIFISAQSNLFSQFSHAFPTVIHPHSVSSLGTGWQGVASLSNEDALTYNPAKLSFTNHSKLSYFRNPFYMAGFGQFPITNVSAFYDAGEIGYFGFSYDNQSWGEFEITSPQHPEGTIKSDYYERSFSLGYSRKLCEEVNAGIGIRYAYINAYNQTPSALLFSLGLTYQPKLLDNKLNFGFSIMNLGTAVEYKYTAIGEPTRLFYDPPPTRLNLGLNFQTTEDEYFSLPVALSISKPFDERDSEKQAQSSFKTLFTDWQDFPNDVSLHTGISFIWKPLNLGNNFSFIQEMYAGNISDGVKTGLLNFYTIGANLGIEYAPYTFKFGYAGVVHNVHYPNYLEWTYPFEAFQFSVEVNEDVFFNNVEITTSKPELDALIISMGIGQLNRLGYAKSEKSNGAELSTENNVSYYAEGAFYFNKCNALVSGLSYNTIPFKLLYMGQTWIDSKYETFSFYSSYRYHLLKSFYPLYVQGGLGIFRSNPVPPSLPKYDYKAALQLSSGLLIDVLKPVMLNLFIDYNLMLDRSTGDAPRMRGYNQIGYGLKIGYSAF